MNRFQILKGKKPRRQRKGVEEIVVPKPEKSSGNLLAEAFLLSTNMMRQFQRRNAENRHHFSNVYGIDFRKEFCTFRFGMPRRSGNTTLALMLLRHYSNSIFITVTQDMLNHIRHQALNFEGRGRGAYSIRQNEQVFRGLSADAVIVDTVSCMDPRHLEKIYLINSEAFFLIG